MTRLEKLRILEAELRAALDECAPNSMAQLARQYRETLREIEELEGQEDGTDEIARILADRQTAAD